jgi:hypothetical protein
MLINNVGININSEVPIADKQSFQKGISTLSVGVMTKEIIDYFNNWIKGISSNPPPSDEVNKLYQNILHICLKKTMGDFGQELEALKYGYIFFANDRPSAVRYMFLKSILSERPGWGGYITTSVNKNKIRTNKLIYIDSKNNIYEQIGTPDDNLIPKSGILISNNDYREAENGAGYEMNINKSNYKTLLLLLIHDIFHDFYDFGESSRSFHDINSGNIDLSPSTMSLPTTEAYEHLVRTYSPTQNRGGGGDDIELDKYEKELITTFGGLENLNIYLSNYVLPWLQGYGINRLPVPLTDDICELDMMIENILYIQELINTPETQAILSILPQPPSIQNIRIFMKSAIYASNKVNKVYDIPSTDINSLKEIDGIVTNTVIMNNLNSGVNLNGIKQMTYTSLVNNIDIEDRIINDLNTFIEYMKQGLSQMEESLDKEEITYGRTRTQKKVIDYIYNSYVIPIIYVIQQGSIGNEPLQIHEYIKQTLLKNIIEDKIFEKYKSNPYVLKELWFAIIFKLTSEDIIQNTIKLFYVFIFSIFDLFIGDNSIVNIQTNQDMYINIFGENIRTFTAYLYKYADSIDLSIKEYILIETQKVINNPYLQTQTDYIQALNEFRTKVQTTIQGGKNRNKKKKTKKKNKKNKKNKKKKKTKRKKKKTKKKKNYNIFDYFM